MSIRLAMRAVLVAILAAVVTGVAIWLALTSDMDTALKLSVLPAYMTVAVAGSFAIGLPLATICYFLGKANGFDGFLFYWIFGNVCAGLMSLLCFIGLGAFGLVFYGIPIFLAANAFAFFGWNFIIKLAKRPAAIA